MCYPHVTFTYPHVTFTMTGGRRLELLVRTLDSFLRNCRDRNLIDSWVISLDRPSGEEKRTIANRYPFVTITDSPRPGQAANLNWLYFDSGLVASEWILHWEDDWDTVSAGHFLREAFDIAESDERIRNVVFRGWDGVCVVDGELEFRTHVYCPGGTRRTMLKLDNEWYGYSLNPSLQHLPTIKMLGRYSEDVETRHFDRPQARAYRWTYGMIRANPVKKYVEHIGGEQPAWSLR